MTVLANLLNAVERFLRRYVVLTDAQAAAVTVWIAHTHAIDAFEMTPYLAINSPTKRSGKSRLLEVVALLVQRALRAAGMTEAALFRSIAGDTPPTLLLDEVDAIFGPKAKEHEDLRALLNAGFARGTPVLRVVRDGSKMTVAEFETFCAKALAGIGALPDTIADRSLVITLKRRSRVEHVERFRQRDAATDAARLRQELAAWGAEHGDELAAARPVMPDELDDRAQDVCEPLLAIAEAAGGDWPERTRRALVALRTAQADGEDDTVGVCLLADIQAVWLDGVDELQTVQLLDALFRVETSPWADWWGQNVKGEFGEASVIPNRGAAMKLARQLKPFGVRPRPIGGNRLKGYRPSDFVDAFARYLASEVVQVVQPEHPSPASDFSRSFGEAPRTTSESPVSGSTTPFEGPERLETENTALDGNGSICTHAVLWLARDGKRRCVNCKPPALPGEVVAETTAS